MQNLYASFMNTEEVERRGLAPVQPLLAEIDAIETVDDLLDYFGRSILRGTGSPLSIDVESDPGDPTRYALFVMQSGLGLPDEEYYRDDRFADIRAAYLAHVAETLSLAGLDADQARLVMHLETEIATRHWNKVRTRDLRQMYNPTRPEAFAATVDWQRTLDAALVPQLEQLIDGQPSFAAELADLIDGEWLPAWRAWARWQLSSSLSPYLPEAFVATRFAFYGTVLTGTPQLASAGSAASPSSRAALGEAVGKLYVERHFSPDAKERMDDAGGQPDRGVPPVHHRAGLDDRGRPGPRPSTSWASSSPKIGYPDKWRDYSDLRDRARRPDRQRAARGSVRARPASWQDRRARSTATSG